MRKPCAAFGRYSSQCSVTHAPGCSARQCLQHSRTVSGQHQWLTAGLAWSNGLDAHGLSYQQTGSQSTFASGQAYLMFGEAEYLDMFTTLYTSAMHGLRLKLVPTAPPDSPSPPPWLADADMDTGQLAHPWISSLSAFWPALQVLAGQSTSPLPAGVTTFALTHITCSHMHCCSCTQK